MSTARKTKTKSAVPPKTNAFLKPKKLGDKKTAATKKVKPVSHFPTAPDGCNGDLSFAEKMDQYAAADSVASAASRKASELKSSIKGFLLENFAKTWASEGSRPVTRTWKAVRTSLDYVMTSYINYTAAKQEAIEEELGLEMDDHFEVTGFKIDLSKLETNQKYFDAFMVFVNTMSEEDMDSDEFVGRVFKLKASFFTNLADLCDKNPDRLHRMLQILDPRANFKNVESSDKEEDLFDLVRDMEG